jgi:hypothetical protein
VRAVMKGSRWRCRRWLGARGAIHRFKFNLSRPCDTGSAAGQPIHRQAEPFAKAISGWLCGRLRGGAAAGISIPAWNGAAPAGAPRPGPGSSQAGQLSGVLRGLQERAGLVDTAGWSACARALRYCPRRGGVIHSIRRACAYLRDCRGWEAA